MLRVENLQTGYGIMPAIYDVSFGVDSGEIVAIVGSNGAGKTTTLKTVAGLLSPWTGSVRYQDQSIGGLKAHRIVRLGIAYVPEGRHLFGKLSVLDNLIVGAYTRRDRAQITESLQQVYELFPRLKERSRQRAETLSGGEQQMVAIARALMSGPRLLMLDEPSLGLMPKLASEVLQFVKRINEAGVTVLLVEQNVKEALKLAHRGFVLQTGKIVAQGTGRELLASDFIRRVYLGL
ncbi:MAG: ABC transporter ATP-binding protein [Firmicutes bacterium]|nr:ABC transporter ATP-binding protein [Bacillota bacterium]